MKYRFYPKARVHFHLVLGLVFTALPIGLSGQTAEPQVTATSPEVDESSGNDVIKVNDLVRVTVFKEDDMLTEARISKSGDITLPLLGPVHVEGKTVAEAVADIRARLDKDYIINPQVSLIIIEYAPSAPSRISCASWLRSWMTLRCMARCTGSWAQVS